LYLNKFINWSFDTFGIWTFWAWAVKNSSRKNIKVDWKSALNELNEAWHLFQLSTCDFEIVLSKTIPEEK